MYGITISDKDDRGFLTVDLIDILRLLGPRAEHADWVVKDLEYLDHSEADEIKGLVNTEKRVPGPLLMRFATTVTQVIEGIFMGYEGSSSQPWIVIKAIDSSMYDVETDDELVLREIERSFKSVKDIPSEEMDTGNVDE